MFLENVFPPIPSELVLPLAGFLLSEGRFGFAAVLAVATAGSVLGSLALWSLGKLFGEERVYRLIGRYGSWALLRVSDVKRAERFFDDHGGKVVFLGRFVPGVRSLISAPAGLADMPVAPFLLYTALGSGLWNTFLIAAGALLRERWRSILGYLDAFEYVAYAIKATLVVWFVLSWLLRRAWLSWRYFQPAPSWSRSTPESPESERAARRAATDEYSTGKGVLWPEFCT